MKHIKLGFDFALQLLLAATALVATPAAADPAGVGRDRCLALSGLGKGSAQGSGIVTAAWHAAAESGAGSAEPAAADARQAVPAHCDIIGRLNERRGVDGQSYAIRYHLRLPDGWNGRFFFQGGGGTNGEIGDAMGAVMGGSAPALLRGFAVVSQDSGHDNAVNTVPGRNGTSAFGFDPQARADYGGASIPPVTEAALQLIKAYYGRAPSHRYFCGCSKGGQEAMMMAQRHPELFDGILSGAPGFALPRAAVNIIWDIRSFAAVARTDLGSVTVKTLAASFGDQDRQTVRAALLLACDRLDGLADGLIADFERCRSARVDPALRRITCAGPKQPDCLSPAQVRALVRTHQGAHDRTGALLYTGFPWDAGWLDPGWRIWKIGSPDGRIPPIHVALGVPSLAGIFMTPPVALDTDADTLLAYAQRFDFERDAPAIYAIHPPFTRSAWQDIGARSSDMRAFAARGAKMIVIHGVSDPVFSINDTIAWFKALNRISRGRAPDFVRLFAVPGMAHCGGGPATSLFDPLTALLAWVENGEAPERILAKAGPDTPWPGRTRPLCVYPKIGGYVGRGKTDEASSFVCS